MTRMLDMMAVSEAAWQKAVSREAIIRPLAFAKTLTSAEVEHACRQLDLKPSRFYELLNRFRCRPVTSSLIGQAPGPKKGRRRLSAGQEDAVALAIKEAYCRRERPTISAVHDQLRHICRKRDLQPPSWKAVKARIDQADAQELAKAREGLRSARQQYSPVVGEYTAKYAMEIVQIDHTLVDLFIVDAVDR